jgi:hypothetical protein
MPQKRDPATIAEAAERLRHPEPTVRVWASRHRARRLLKVGKTVWYDYVDLATIEGCLHRGVRVPKTPEARDLLRASYLTAA